MRRNDDNLRGDILPVRCKCGAQARVRYRIPLSWVECKNKCGMHTRYYPDDGEQFNPEARNKAIIEWNKLMEKNTN